jgi:hypothetical protein
VFGRGKHQLMRLAGLHPATSYQKRLAIWRRTFAGLSESDRWAIRQAIAEPSRYYGASGTIHQTGEVNVEVDESTLEVVSLWFRCQMLPFSVHYVRPARADEMRAASMHAKNTRLTGVEVLDEPQEPDEDGYAPLSELFRDG